MIGPCMFRNRPWTRFPTGSPPIDRPIVLVTTLIATRQADAKLVMTAFDRASRTSRYMWSRPLPAGLPSDVTLRAERVGVRICAATAPVLDRAVCAVYPRRDRARPKKALARGVPVVRCAVWGVTNSRLLDELTWPAAALVCLRRS